MGVKLSSSKFAYFAKSINKIENLKFKQKHVLFKAKKSIRVENVNSNPM